MSRRQLDLELLRRHAVVHAAAWNEIDLASPVDRGRPFLCETLTPLYYTGIYSELAPEHALRYNQITGLAFNEIIGFFETHFAQPILAALVTRPGLPDALIDAMTRFAEEERRHTVAFRALNRLSEPGWYAGGDHYLLRPRPAALAALRWVTGHPELFPAVIWIALVMEEKSLATSRALIRAGDGVIEPHFLAVHRAHLQDEVRHVQLDWHMLDHLYAGRGRWLRRANARLFCFLLTRFFLSPAHAGRRAVEILIAERPELSPLAPRLLGALAALERDPEYHRMMYSREVTPIAFALFDRFAEFRPLGERLLSYEPALEGDLR